MAKFLLATILFPISVWAWLPQSEPGEQNEKPEAIEGVGIEEKLNQSLPSQVNLINEAGKNVTLSQFLGRDRPVIFSLVYYNCPSLCNLHLRGVFEVFKDLNLTPGKDFEFVALSIDPKETPDLAQAKKEVYIKEYGLEAGLAGIHFLTGGEEEVKKAADAVGFKYKWVESAKEWAHASAAIISTPEGKISRYMHGVYFDPKTFRLSLVEASEGKIGNIVDQFALFCFRYDPKANQYALYAFNALRAGAGILVLLLLAWLVPTWIRQRRQAVRH